GRLADHLVVEEDIVDGEWNVVLRLELDRVTELLGGDLGERHPLDDRLPSRDGDDRTGSADPGFLDAFLDRVGHDLGLANRSLGDDVSRKRNGREGLQREAALALHELDELHRAGTYVEPERRRLLTES